MHVVGIIKQKGGAGATTTTVHLALAAARAGRRPVIADTDPQQSAVAWAKARERDDIPVAAVPASQLRAFVKAAAQDGYDLVLIDTAPRHDADIAAAARASDLCLLPTKVGGFDLAAMSATAALVQGLKRPAVIVMTQVPRDGTEGPEARTALETYGIPVWPGQLSDLKAYRQTVNRGRTVMDPHDRRDWRGLDLASGEISALWQLVAERLGH
jgi:chromosome partitioning protein